MPALHMFSRHYDACAMGKHIELTCYPLMWLGVDGLALCDRDPEEQILSIAINKELPIKMRARSDTSTPTVGDMADDTPTLEDVVSDGMRDDADADTTAIASDVGAAFSAVAADTALADRIDEVLMPNYAVQLSCCCASRCEPASPLANHK